MTGPAILPDIAPEGVETPTVPAQQRRRHSRGPMPVAFHAAAYDEQMAVHQAELFYLQKQIQSQTQMVIVMEDGETISGCIEWYDRNALKIRGRSRMLVYKSAIKYMYKQGENG
jgi:sRNA-binding regulator protein Hfq